MLDLPPVVINQIDIKYLDPRYGEEFTYLEYKSEGAAGLDVRACIFETLVIYPGQTVKIPLGFALHIDNINIAAFLLPRSGLGGKGLVLGNLVGTIDSDFQGQVCALAWNRTIEDKLIVEPGERLAQLIFLPVIHPTLNIVKEFSTKTVRGSSGFGDSGRF